MTETEELKERFLEATMALEEMVMFQEGKMPMRVMEVQRRQGYSDARKLVLNDCRSTLRRLKTYMFQIQMLKNPIDDKLRVANGNGTSSDSRALTGQDRSVAVSPGGTESAGPRPLNLLALVTSASAIVVFLAGFVWPLFHTWLSGLAVIGWVTLAVYWEIVGVKL